MPSITTDRDLASAVGVMVLAFHSDPLVRWIFPDAVTFLDSFRRVALIHGGRAREHRTGYRTSDGVGAAFWFPPGVTADVDALGGVFDAALSDERLQAVTQLLGLMDQCHPREPHWYLRLIGVDPSEQNGGIGAGLLSEGLRRVDSESAVAYLEATGERSVPFYQRYGFKVLDAVHVDGAPTIWPMVRHAR